MAFKMNGMGFGVGTGREESNRSRIKTKPETGKWYPDEDVSAFPKHEPGHELSKIDKGRVKRKRRKAAKLRSRAEELRAKGGSDKRVARLEKRATKKEKRADWKEGQAANIEAGRDKKSDLTDTRTGMGGTKYDDKGKRKKDTTPKTRVEHAKSKDELKGFVKKDDKGKDSLSSYNVAWEDKSRWTTSDDKKSKKDKFGNVYTTDASGKTKFKEESEKYWKSKGL